MKQDKPIEQQDVMDKAIRLLSTRAHSCRELSLKLFKRGYPRKMIDNVISECKRLHLLNDNEFAINYIEELKNRGYGPRRISAALYKKGIDKELACSLLEETDSQEQQLERAKTALKRKMPTFNREQEPRKKREKIVRFLSGRGFSSDIIFQLLNQDENDL
jgi:regulatory protein